MSKGGAGDSILDQVAHRPPFKQRRDLACTRPERARDKLKGYATLELKVVKARSLKAADLLGTSDPYVEVFLDDSLKDKTPIQYKNLNPIWNWEKKIEIKHPSSVILLRVMDSDIVGAHDMLGFVEFPVSDLPLNTLTTGWFSLAPPKELTGKAPERLKKCLEEAREPSEGEVYLEVTRKIVSDDPEDERFAWCLPAPQFHEYPEEGWKRKKLDAQGLIDSIMDFKSALLGGFIRPLLKGVGFVLGWHNLPMTLVVLSALLGMSIRPEYFLTGLFGMFGLILLLMSDPAVSAAMALQPTAVPLNDEGYKLIAKTSNTDNAVTYLSRVVQTIQGQVQDEDMLREFAAFSSFEGEAVAESYADLKRQLHKARTGGGFEEAFISVEGKPLQKGALVSRSGQKGEILKCLNPDEVLAWKYEVKFDDLADPKEVVADELDARTDMRWMSGDAVLAMIPDSVEDSLTGWTEFFRSLTITLKGVEQPIRDIAGWKDKAKSAGVAFVCLGLSVLFIWLQRAFFFIAFSLLFAKNTEMWVAFFAKRAGQQAAAQQHSRSMAEWGFYKEAKEAPEEEKTGSLKGFTDSLASKMNTLMGKK